MQAALSIRRRPANRRVRRWLFILCLVLAAGLIGPLVAQVGASSAERQDRVRVTVQEGDTLWEIASRFTGRRGDVRETVYRIRQANDLRTSVVYPGQVIVVPALQ